MVTGMFIFCILYAAMHFINSYKQLFHFNSTEDIIRVMLTGWATPNLGLEYLSLRFEIFHSKYGNHTAGLAQVKLTKAKYSFDNVTL